MINIYEENLTKDAILVFILDSVTDGFEFGIKKER